MVGAAFGGDAKLIVDPWLKIREILEDALDQLPSQRLRFIAEACAGNAELQHEVEEYLRYEQAAEHNLSIEKWIHEEPAPAEDDCDPERIGVYLIVRRLGEGGMGVVYLAERDDAEYRQEVALKVLKPGPQSAQSLRLFRRERQILAQLEHPNIAYLMDGGTANGRVFYVMEYIKGSPVTVYCNERELTVRERLKLFCRICEPVSYAHRKLIIHRDLKPGNILVTADGIPKLLDFGLAKVFQDSLSASPEATASIGPMLTPAYACPEQIRGEPLSTAADVYSLGVLLYELLTGQNPQAREDQSPFEVCRTILDEDPKPPSQGVDPTQRRHLKGDLDSIVLKALSKEPERRYTSVDEFREDIERYLGGFPVRASQGSTVYHARKYLSRHRWGIAVSLLGTVIVLGAVAATWWEGRQAEKRFDDVRGLAHSVIFELHDAVRDLPGSTAARKLIVERALEYLGKLEATGAQKRELQLEMAAAYSKIGEVQGDFTIGRNSHALGDTAGAAKSYGQARHLLRDLLRTNKQDQEVLEALADVDEDLANVVLKLGNREQERKLWQEAAAIRNSLVQRNPPAPAARARALWNVAEGLFLAHNWEGAAPAFRDALSEYQRLASLQPANREYREQVALCQRRLCYVEAERKHWQASLEAGREALRLDSAQAEAMPDDRTAEMALSWDWDNVGYNLQRLGDLKASAQASDHAIAIARKLSLEDPLDLNAAVSLACWLNNAAEVYEEMGPISKAFALRHEAIRVFDKEFRHDPNNHQVRGMYAVALADKADLHTRRKSRLDWQAAAGLYRQAEELFAPLGNELALDENEMAEKADLPRRLALCESHLAKAH